MRSNVRTTNSRTTINELPLRAIGVLEIRTASLEEKRRYFTLTLGSKSLEFGRYARIKSLRDSID